MSRSGWVKKDDAIAAALEHAREKRMCLAAKTELGVELLDRRARTGALMSPFAHLYEEPEYWGELKPPEKAIRVIRGAALLHPDWVFCSVSAALAYDLQVSCPDASVVHIATTPKAHRRSNPQVRCHMVEKVEVCSAGGVRVVDIETCLRQCLCSLDLKFGLAVADSYLRKEQLVAADLEAMLARGKKRRQGIRQARKTASLASPLPENGGESVARGAMIELGFEIPQLQVEVDNPLEPGNPFRVDFLWPECVPRTGNRGGIRPVIGELDGMDKYRDADMLGGKSTIRALSDERVRESRLSMAGASIVRFRFGETLNPRGFARLLDAAGVPRAGML